MIAKDWIPRAFDLQFCNLDKGGRLTRMAGWPTKAHIGSAGRQKLDKLGKLAKAKFYIACCRICGDLNILIQRCSNIGRLICFRLRPAKIAAQAKSLLTCPFARLSARLKLSINAATLRTLNMAWPLIWPAPFTCE